jgi:hypothetical protein
MMERFPRARWVALASIVALSFASGAWLSRPAPSAEGGIYQQARLFENVVSAIHKHFIDSLGEGDLYSAPRMRWSARCTIPMPSCWWTSRSGNTRGR